MRTDFLGIIKMGFIQLDSSNWYPTGNCSGIWRWWWWSQELWAG